MPSRVSIKSSKRQQVSTNPAESRLENAFNRLGPSRIFDLISLDVIATGSLRLVIRRVDTSSYCYRALRSSFTSVKGTTGDAYGEKGDNSGSHGSSRVFDLSNARCNGFPLVLRPSSLARRLGSRINSRNIGDPLDFSNRDDLCSRFRASCKIGLPRGRERAKSFPNVSPRCNTVLSNFLLARPIFPLK